MSSFKRVSALVLVAALSLSGCVNSPDAVAVIGSQDVTFAQVDEQVAHYIDGDPLFNRLVKEGAITKESGEATLRHMAPNILISLASLRKISDNLGLKPLRMDEVESSYLQQVEAIGGQDAYIDQIVEVIKTNPSGQEPISITMVKEGLVQIPMLEQRIGERLKDNPEEIQKFMALNGIDDKFENLPDEVKDQVMQAFGRYSVQAEQAKLGIKINPILQMPSGANIFGDTTEAGK